GGRRGGRWKTGAAGHAPAWGDPLERHRGGHPPAERSRCPARRYERGRLTPPASLLIGGVRAQTTGTAATGLVAGERFSRPRASLARPRRVLSLIQQSIRECGEPAPLLSGLNGRGP